MITKPGRKVKYKVVLVRRMEDWRCNSIYCKPRHMLEDNDISRYQSLHPGTVGELLNVRLGGRRPILTFWCRDTFRSLLGIEL